jgi:hypothetical protein
MSNTLKNLRLFQKLQNKKLKMNRNTCLNFFLNLVIFYMWMKNRDKRLTLIFTAN